MVDAGRAASTFFLVDVYPGFTKSPIDSFGTGLNNLLGFDLSHKYIYISTICSDDDNTAAE